MGTQGVDGVDEIPFPSGGMDEGEGKHDGAF